MSEMDLNQINMEIEGQIKKYASNVELTDNETVLRVTIPDAVGLDQKFQIDWWLEFINQALFQWDGRTFYCFDVEPTDDSHVWICRLIDLHEAFPPQKEQEIEGSNQEPFEHQG